MDEAAIVAIARSFARSYRLNEEAARDMVVEAVLILYEKADAIALAEYPEAFARTAVKRRLLNWIRQDARHLTEERPAPSPDYEDGIEAEDGGGYSRNAANRKQRQPRTWSPSSALQPSESALIAAMDLEQERDALSEIEDIALEGHLLDIASRDVADPLLLSPSTIRKAEKRAFRKLKDTLGEDWYLH